MELSVLTNQFLLNSFDFTLKIGFLQSTVEKTTFLEIFLEQ